MAENAARRRRARENRNKGGKGKSSMVYKCFERNELLIREKCFEAIKHNSNSQNIIMKEDIHATYGDLGVEVPMQNCEKMLGGNKELTFPQFLGLLNTSDDVPDKKSELIAAFETFDTKGGGLIPQNVLNEILTDPRYDDPLTPEEADALLMACPKGNNIDIEKVVDLIKIGTCEGPTAQ